jgi:hypothetical protein
MHNFITAVEEAIRDGFIHIFQMEDAGFLKSNTLLGKIYAISRVQHPVKTTFGKLEAILC